MSDPCNLRRFVDAQAAVYDEVTRELREGRKRAHWMWFVFPQLQGLGRTATADRFGIASLDEARAYLADPVLGARLRECAAFLRDHPEREPIEAVLGHVDALKLRSCMTLFLRAGADEADRALFQAVLDRYYGGGLDERTLELLSEG